MTDDQIPYYAQSAAKTLEVMKASQNGLSKQDVGARLEQYGKNELPREKKAGWLLILLRQFLSPLMIILIVALIVSIAFGDYIDGIMIAAAVVINVIVGFIQEFRASNALEKLRSFIHPTVRVRRGGSEFEIEASGLVPGDIILLAAGDQAPADARLILVEGVETNEAALTGESQPISKNMDSLQKGTVLAERKNMVYAGTSLTHGRAEAVVTATGLNSELGRIAVLVAETKEETTPLQEQLIRLSRFLAVLYVIVAILIFVVGILLGKSIFEMFILSVALAVAAVPEGLLVAVTVVLAVGMQRMLRQHALIRRLLATETLGSVSVICTDKTGTITEASMRVSSVVTSDTSLSSTAFRDAQQFKSVLRAIEIGVICNDAAVADLEGPISPERYIGSPTEIALLMAGETIGMKKEELNKKHVRISEIPFDSEWKYMVVLVDQDDGRFALMKGAAERVLDVSSKYYSEGNSVPMKDSDHERFVHEAEVMTERGLRVLGFAFKIMPEEQTKLSKQDVGEFVFVGFMGLRDPVRPTAKATIAEAASAGIRTVIVTGDHPRTVGAIAQDVELSDSPRVMTGAELDDMSDDELEKRVVDYDVFARVEPVHKVRIVRAWQKRGQTVSMTGDGVNDAPAPKAANIGVALGNGTDVAKETADMVLLDNNLETIVSAVKEGRVIFDNIRKVVMFLLINGFSEMTLIFLSLIFRVPLPLIAAQILYINIITDGAPAIALTIEPAEEGVMKEPPRKRGTPIMTKNVKYFVFGLGLVLNIVPFPYFLYLLSIGYGVEHAQTVMFTILSLETLVMVFAIRSYRHTIWSSKPFANKTLVISAVAGLLLTVLAIYTPGLQRILRTVDLGLMDWVAVGIILAMELVVVEVYKYFTIIRRSKKKVTTSA